MMETIINTLVGWMTGIPGWLVTFLLSMVPVVELRGGMIVAAMYHLPIPLAFIICYIGNLLPVPFILWLVTPIFNRLKKTKLFRPLVVKLENMAMGKSEKIKKAEFWGLVVFVGIPLPGTGAWTGSLIASMLNIDKKKALYAVMLGILLAAVIMMILSYGIPFLISLFG